MTIEIYGMDLSAPCRILYMTCEALGLEYTKHEVDLFKGENKTPEYLKVKIFFYILWKKSRLKSTFLPYHVKKHHSTLEMDTFKVMLLLSYLDSLDN